MRNLTRMLPWALLALLFYTAALATAQPQIQTLLWKVGHITLGANIGYWIDRTAFQDRLNPNTTDPIRAMARAVVVAAAILGLSLGL
jgi:hypothetical protein